MIDSRFSAEAFKKAGLDTPKARKLADALAREVEAEVKRHLSESVEAVVNRLNRLGHRLRLVGDEPDGLSFRDEDDAVAGSPTRLRLAVDFVVSTGYAHMKTIEEVERELFSDSAGKLKPGKRRRRKR